MKGTLTWPTPGRRRDDGSSKEAKGKGRSGLSTRRVAFEAVTPGRKKMKRKVVRGHLLRVRKK